MELLLLILTTFNMYTVDTHSVNYKHIAIESAGVTYHIEEDYSITIEYKGVNHNEWNNS